MPVLFNNASVLHKKEIMGVMSEARKIGSLKGTKLSNFSHPILQLKRHLAALCKRLKVLLRVSLNISVGITSDCNDLAFVSHSQTSYITSNRRADLAIRHTVSGILWSSTHLQSWRASETGYSVALLGCRGQCRGFLSDNQLQLCPLDFPKLWLRCWQSSLKDCLVKVTA